MGWVGNLIQGGEILHVDRTVWDLKSGKPSLLGREDWKGTEHISGFKCKIVESFCYFISHIISIFS